jgi:adenine-specific DNA-methyltransferase
MTPEQASARGIPAAYLRPILPCPRELEADEVMADDDGYPLLARKRLLLDCSEAEELLRERHPALWRYLQAGVAQVSGGYLCSRRSPWYSQEARQSTPFLCSYIARRVRADVCSDSSSIEASRSRPTAT